MFGYIQLSTKGIFHRLERLRAKNNVVVCLQKYIVIYSQYFSQIREVQGRKRRSRMFRNVQLSTLSFFIDKRGSGPKTTQSYVWKCIVIYSEYFSQIRKVKGQKRRSPMFGNIQLSTLSIFHRLERFRPKNDVVKSLEIYSYLL